ncbi:MAG TPA: TlpA disulfide reductase family protein [Thermoanaerobaculia bacterium]|nr:TlpA disulfide reductase family protein [Thermoanaerobaculia bacterium]
MGSDPVGAEGEQIPTRAFRWQAWGMFWLAVACAALAVGWPQHQATGTAPGGFLFDASGQPASLGERLAPVTLVHFWATWCPPCLTEIPSLSRLGKDVQTDGFAILFVAVDDQVGRVQEFLGSSDEGVLFDPDWQVAHRYDVFKLPETVLLVGNRFVDKFVGAQDWDSPDVRRRLADKVAEERKEGLRFASGG